MAVSGGNGWREMALAVVRIKDEEVRVGRKGPLISGCKWIKE